MLDDFDLFSTMGFVPVEQEELKCKKKKLVEVSVIDLDKEKKTNRKSSSKKSSSDLKFKIPVIVYTGYREPMEFGKDTFDKEYVNQDELFNEVIKIAPEYDISYSELQQDSKNKSIAYLGFKSSQSIRKGKVNLTSKSVIMLADSSSDLSELMSNDTCDVEIKAISDYFSNEVPVISNIAIIQKDDKIVPIFDMKPLSSEDITFPIRVFIFGRGRLEITEEAYLEFITSLGNEINEGEIIKFDKDICEQLIVDKYPDFGDGHLEIQYNKDVNILVPTMKLKIAKVSITKGEKLYPTDAIISLVWTQYKLEPSIFGGEKEVTEKEIINYLSTIHCEYQPNTTTLIYDEKLNIIKPMYKGSSKGSNIELISNSKVLLDRCDVEKYGYQLFEYLYKHNKTSKLFRVESTPVSLTIAPINHNEGGRFEFRLPKVPFSIFRLINIFFEKVSTLYDTEVMLRLFYKKDTQGYYLELPVQRVTSSTIHAEFDQIIQMDYSYIHIADFHSHNKYPAFFSDIDNRDEKANLVYGVFGPYNMNTDAKFCLRASTGGYYKNIKIDDLFTESKSKSIIDEDIESFSNQLLFYATDRIIVQK